jgi:hypothetical protein
VALAAAHTARAFSSGTAFQWKGSTDKFWRISLSPQSATEAKACLRSSAFFVDVPS